MVKREVDNIGASLSHKGPDNSMIALHGKFDTIAPWCVVNLEEFIVIVVGGPKSNFKVIPTIATGQGCNC